MNRWDGGTTTDNLDDYRLRAERRRITETVLLTLFTLLVLGAAWRWGETEPPEVTLEPISVQMHDPYPCSTNPTYRLAYQRLGAVCGVEVGR